MVKDHILNHENILMDFNLSTKVTEKEISEIEKQVKKTCKDKTKINDLIKKEIINKTNDKFKNNNYHLPGVIIKESIDSQEFKWATEGNSNTDSKQSKKSIQILKDKKFKDINKLSISILNDIYNNKKFDDEQFMFLIFSMIEASGKTDEEFNEFYKKIQDDEEDDKHSEEEEGI